MNSYNSKIQEVVNEAIEVLIDEHSTTEDKVSAASLLGSLAEFSAINPLCQALNNTSVLVRISAAEALGRLCGRIRNSDAVEHLYQSLRDPFPEVVCHASIALGKIGDHSSVEVLHETLQYKADIILSLVSAVEMIGSKDSLVALTRYKVQIELLQAALEKTIKKIQVENHYTDNDPIDLLRKISKGIDTMAEKTDQPTYQSKYQVTGNPTIVEGNMEVKGDSVAGNKNVYNYATDPNLLHTIQNLLQQNTDLNNFITELETQSPNPQTEAEAEAARDQAITRLQTTNPTLWQTIRQQMRTLKRQILNPERHAQAAKATLVEVTKAYWEKSLIAKAIVTYIDKLSETPDQGA
jgi:HEAT repeats